MSGNAHPFTPEQQAYLRTLPAVRSVSQSRITYTESFKYECMRRYELGESPSKIFLRAGFDPKVIGGKRIERCIARWKKTWNEEKKTSHDEAQLYLRGNDMSRMRRYDQLIDDLTDMRAILDRCLRDLRQLDGHAGDARMADGARLAGDAQVAGGSRMADSAAEETGSGKSADRREPEAER